MNKQKLLLVGALILIVVVGVVAFFKGSDEEGKAEQIVLEKTVRISREYLALRYRTDNVLINARELRSYEQWDREMSKIVSDWKLLETDAAELQKVAEALPVQEISLAIVKPAQAYDRNEISNVFDKAPPGKKIATLAKHLGVDAKKAQMILNQDQAQVTADAWNEAGDTFQKLESSAVVIKDGCKVAGFVGTIALSGGTSAIMAGSTLAKASVVISGADLVLEVTDDTAKIALGNNNKVSAIVSEARTVTEPIAGLITIVNIPGNVSKAIDKLNVISFTAEQINSGIQNGAVIGIEIPEIKIELNEKFNNIKKYKTPVYVSKIDKGEIDRWLNENNIDTKVETKEEIEAVLKLEEVPKTNKTINTGSLGGTRWKGVLVNTSGGDRQKRSTDFEITLNTDGSCAKGQVEEDTETSSLTWSQEGNMVKIFGEDKTSGYYVFELLGDNSMVFSRIVVEGGDVLAGSDFMGGIAPVGTLYKQ